MHFQWHSAQLCTYGFHHPWILYVLYCTDIWFQILIPLSDQPYPPMFVPPDVSYPFLPYQPWHLHSLILQVQTNLRWCLLNVLSSSQGSSHNLLLHQIMYRPCLRDQRSQWSMSKESLNHEKHWWSGRSSSSRLSSAFLMLFPFPVRYGSVSGCIRSNLSPHLYLLLLSILHLRYVRSDRLIFLNLFALLHICLNIS